MKFCILPHPQKDWRQSRRGQAISVARKRLFTSESKVFAIGSCFALEIRNALRRRGYDVYPKYRDIPFNKGTQLIGTEPHKHDNINHYDPFVLKQEIDRALAKAVWPRASFWELRNPTFRATPFRPVWLDPHRRHVYAATPEEAALMSDKVSAAVDEGLAVSDVVIMTLGLTEGWRIKTTGLHFCIYPTDSEECKDWIEFNSASFLDAYAAVRSSVDAILAVYPKKQMVLTVSPVALHRTYHAEDVVVANMQSKATLRSVAGQITRELPEQVTYWPSFEFVMRQDAAFGPDGRHVRGFAVDQIVSAFIEAHG